MDNDVLTILKEDPNVLYIYNRGSIIYRSNTEDSDIDFLVVVNNNFRIPKQFRRNKYSHHFKREIKYNLKCDNLDFIFFTIDEWFARVMNNDLYAWECACLNKKFIHKEHVKLLLSTDLVQLRKNFDSKYYEYTGKAKRAFDNNHIDTAVKILWYVIKDALFTNQIMINHKIVNYTAATSFKDKLKECENDELFKVFDEIIEGPYNEIKKLTDGMLKLTLERKYANI